MGHREYMKEALALAGRAMDMGEVPVGAVIVRDGIVIGRGWNTKESEGRATGHAEIMAIEEACRYTGDWRLEGCTLYVNLEPCPMCSGAILSARIDTVVYSLIDFKSGALGGKIDLSKDYSNHSVNILSGICEDEARDMMDLFFEKLRQKPVLDIQF